MKKEYKISELEKAINPYLRELFKGEACSCEFDFGAYYDPEKDYYRCLRCNKIKE